MRLEEKYKGRVAEEYLTERVDTHHWRREQQIVSDMLREAGGASLIDVPVGTGRFLAFYKALELRVIGFDISPDMLKEARTCADAQGVLDLELQIGDIRGLPVGTGSADVVVCIRYMQHVSLEDFRVVMHELVRVSSKTLIVGVHILQVQQGVRRVIRAVVAEPVAMIRRLVKQIKRRTRARERGIQTNPKNTEKPDSAVRDCFEEFGLRIKNEKLVATGLNPTRLIEYRIFHLEKL